MITIESTPGNSIEVKIGNSIINGKTIYWVMINDEYHPGITNRNKILSLIEKAMREEFS